MCGTAAARGAQLPPKLHAGGKGIEGCQGAAVTASKSSPALALGPRKYLDPAFLGFERGLC